MDYIRGYFHGILRILRKYLSTKYCDKSWVHPLKKCWFAIVGRLISDFLSKKKGLKGPCLKEMWKTIETKMFFSWKWIKTIFELVGVF